MVNKLILKWMMDKWANIANLNFVTRKIFYLITAQIATRTTVLITDTFHVLKYCKTQLCQSLRIKRKEETANSFQLKYVNLKHLSHVLCVTIYFAFSIEWKINTNAKL